MTIPDAELFEKLSFFIGGYLHEKDPYAKAKITNSEIQYIAGESLGKIKSILVQDGWLKISFEWTRGRMGEKGPFKLQKFALGYFEFRISQITNFIEKDRLVIFNVPINLKICLIPEKHSIFESFEIE